MEQVIRTYGKFVLEAIVFALLIWLLVAGLVDEEGNQGVFRMLGAHIEEEAVFARGDVERYQWEGEQSAPAITYVNVQILQPGIYDVDAIINATNSQGERIPVTVESVRDPYGMVQMGGNLSEVSQLPLMVPGIYTLRVSAKDAGNRMSTCEFRVPVNYREVTN